MNEFLRADYEKWLNSQPSLTKEEYIEKFLELYDNSDWIYEQMLPNLELLKNEKPEEYTEKVILIKQGEYSNEKMRKILEERLSKEDGLKVKSLYEEAVRNDRYLNLQPWLNKKIKVTNASNYINLKNKV